MPYRFRKKETIQDAVQRISCELFRKAAEQLQSAMGQGAAADPADEGDASPQTSPIHETRKYIKKLRALVRLIRDRIGEEAGQVIVLLRDASRLLSGTRDRQAMVEVLDSLATHTRHANAANAITDVKAVLLKQRDDDTHDNHDNSNHDNTNGQNTDTLSVNIASALDQLEQAAAMIGQWTITPGGFSAIKRGLYKAIRNAKVAMQIAFEEPTDENLHEWRKQVKNHWYHIRLLRSTWPAMMQAHADQLGALSDQLGEDHDLSLLAQRISDAPFDDNPDMITLRECIHRRQSQLRSQSFELGARLFAEKPTALEQRLHAYWRAWRAPKSKSNPASGSHALEPVLQLGW